MKNFLTKLGLVEDDTPAVKPKAAPTPTATQQAPAGYVPPQAPSSFTTFTATPAIDPGIRDMLQQSLQENKLNGFDYLKFISAVEESKSTGVPEDARFKMTFSTAKQLGVDKNTLLKSGNHYIEVLAQDESDFNADCAHYEKSEVESRATKLASVESTIASLSSQLSQLNQDRATLAHELEQEKSKLESKKAAFRTTLESVRTTIQANIDKINQYLQ